MPLIRGACAGNTFDESDLIRGVAAIVADGAIASAICIVQMLRGNVRGGVVRPSEAPVG